MRKCIVWGLAFMFALSLFAGIAVSADQAPEKGKAQTHCPVLGGKIDKNAYTDYKGKRVYFCCPGCKANFDKDPDGYIKKLEDQGVVLEKSPGAN